MNRKPLAIPIVDAATQRVAGGFCQTREAVSEDELAALEQLRRLRAEAQEIKSLLEQAPPPDRPPLANRLTELRQQAALWRQRKEEATQAKHQALGHVTLALDG